MEINDKGRPLHGRSGGPRDLQSRQAGRIVEDIRRETNDGGYTGMEKEELYQLLIKVLMSQQDQNKAIQDLLADMLRNGSVDNLKTSEITEFIGNAPKRDFPEIETGYVNMEEESNLEASFTDLGSETKSDKEITKSVDKLRKLLRKEGKD